MAGHAPQVFEMSSVRAGDVDSGSATGGRLRDGVLLDAAEGHC